MSEAFFIITVASDVQGLGSLCFCLLLPTFFLSLPGQHLGGFALEAPPPTLLPAPPLPNIALLVGGDGGLWLGQCSASPSKGSRAEELRPRDFPVPMPPPSHASPPAVLFCACPGLGQPELPVPGP